MEEGRDDGDNESIIRAVNHLIQAGLVRLGGDGEDEDEEEMESDEEEQLTLKEALASTESLMMGGSRRPRCPPPDLSRLRDNDLGGLTKAQTGGERSLRSRAPGAPSATPHWLRRREMGGLPRRNGATSAAATSAAEAVAVQAPLLPNRPRLLAAHQTKTFCAQFSENGRILITASQDHRIRFYREAERGNWREYRRLVANDVGWSILDVELSPDGQHLIYGTWSDNIHEFSLYGPEAGTIFQSYRLQSPDYRFCVFSLRFSADGAEILGGASDKCIYVFDREYKALQHRIHAHDDDINAVAFADPSSKILVSGGDDGLLKVWDRRELRESGAKPVGVFAGHLDGITFIDSRGDGRYLLSNSKDQSMKLWDVRAFSSEATVAAAQGRAATEGWGWDYRWQSVPRRMRRRQRMDGDASVMSYSGAHTVQHTLIRCAFSPLASTGQSMVVSGCARGAVVFYDLLSGEVVGRRGGHNACVRDFAWHPTAPLLASASWDGRTLLWRYDERQERNINPEAAADAAKGDEDSEDEFGNPLSGPQDDSHFKRPRLTLRTSSNTRQRRHFLLRRAHSPSPPSPPSPPTPDLLLSDEPLEEPSTPPPNCP